MHVLSGYGEAISRILNLAKPDGHPIHVVQTFNRDPWTTDCIATWMNVHGGKLEVVSLDGNGIVKLHDSLVAAEFAHLATFHIQDAQKFLSGSTWLDCAFLGPDSLNTGETEFRLAASAGARVIAIPDYQTKAAFAVRAAQSLGWSHDSYGPYSVLRRG